MSHPRDNTTVRLLGPPSYQPVPFAKSRHRRTPFYPNFPASSRTFRARASKFADGSRSLCCFVDVFRPAPSADTSLSPSQGRR